MNHMITSRRALLAGVAGVLAAPAIVRASSLMPLGRAVATIDLAEINATRLAALDADLGYQLAGVRRIVSQDGGLFWDVGAGCLTIR
jgi:hypothetical protein